MSRTERIHADHAVVKHLGNWTGAGHFEVKARKGVVVLDLRSPDLPGDLGIHLDMDRAVVKLLVDDGTVIDHWDLTWTARGKVRDSPSAAAGDNPDGRRRRGVRLSGSASDSQVRVRRGGVAILSAMCSRAFLQDARRAHRTGGVPTIDDPARGRRS